MRHDRRSTPRMFNGDRRKNWVLPGIAAVLALFLMWRDVQAERVWGIDGKGKAFVCELAPPYPLIEFCLRLTQERR